MVNQKHPKYEALLLVVHSEMNQSWKPFRHSANKMNSEEEKHESQNIFTH